MQAIIFNVNKRLSNMTCTLPKKNTAKKLHFFLLAYKYRLYLWQIIV